MEKKLNFTEWLFYCLCRKSSGSISKIDSLSLEERLEYQKKVWQEFWLRMGEPVLDCKGKNIVDYGCGLGYDSLFMLQSGAKHVHCLEVTEDRLWAAEKLHRSHGFSNTSYIDNRNVADLSRKIGKDCIDFICCRDVMEHVSDPIGVIQSMHEILNEGGMAYIGFSPVWKSPFGAHIRSKCRVPWIHLLFSEETIVNVLKKKFDAPQTAQRYLDLEGYGANKMSFFKYDRMLRNFDWSIDKHFVNTFPARPMMQKIIKTAVALMPLNTAKEFCIVNSYARMCKKTPIASPVEYVSDRNEQKSCALLGSVQ